MCVVDPENSIFYSAWSGDPSAFTGRPSRIEGIGRQRVEPSFLPDVVDRHDPGAGRRLDRGHAARPRRTGRSVGGSTGTNVWGAFLLVAEMLARGEQGSVVTLICDGGERYADTYYNDAWLADQGLELAPYTEALEAFLETGAFPPPVPRLDLGDHALDRFDHLGRHLVHPVSVARVRLDLREKLLLVLVSRHPLAARHHVTAPELLHEPPAVAPDLAAPSRSGLGDSTI